MISTRRAILAELDTAIRKRDPRLAQQLRPGQSHNAVVRRLRRVIGETEPLLDLYTWHDGTEPLRRSDGDTHVLSLLELSLIPGELCIFEELEASFATFVGWSEIAEYHGRIKEAVGRYFPLLWDGSDTWLTLDLKPGQKGRIVYFELQNDSPFRTAYPTFDDFLLDALRANETGLRLRVFDEGLAD